MSKTVKIESQEQLAGLLASSRIVVADFYADWCRPCQTIAPMYEQLSTTLSRPGSVTFVKIDTDKNKDVASQYSITSLPTFIVFRGGRVAEKVQGADPARLQSVVQGLVTEVRNGDAGGSSREGSSSAAAGGAAAWKGAELPRGYADVTAQIELKGCDVLNADDDAGTVRVLFGREQPSGLQKGKAVAGDKDWVQSGADDQLLLFMPFQSMIKLHTLQITSLPPPEEEDAPMRPAKIQLYTNQPHNMDFTEADDTPPTQTIELKPSDWNAEGTASIGLRYVKFQNITSLVLYVSQGEGEGETVRLDRVRLVGESGEKRSMGKLEKISHGDE